LEKLKQKRGISNLMLTDEEKQIYADWTMIDFQLTFEPLTPRKVPEVEKKWLEELKEYISFNQRYREYLKSNPDPVLSHEEYERALRDKFTPWHPPGDDKE
jgi:hypothetical protein